MYVIRTIYNFALEGVRGFLRASVGNFHEESKEVKHNKKNLMGLI